MIPESAYDPELMDAVTELGAALRELVGASVATTVDVEVLRSAAARARGITADLAVATRPATQLPVLDDPVAFRRVFSPVNGVGSAIAPPLTFRAVEGGRPGEIEGTATLGLQYEGPPGFVHGGMSGLLMDQVLGSAAVAGGRWGMTAHLELDYRGPVPLQTPLVLRGWVAGEHGRRTDMAGSIATAADPERVLVEVSGVFVTPRDEVLGEYFGAITDAAGRHAPPRRGAPVDTTPDAG